MCPVLFCWNLQPAYLLDLLRLPPVNVWGPPGWEVLPRSSEQAQGQGCRPRYGPFCRGKHKLGPETHVTYLCRERRCWVGFCIQRRGAKGHKPAMYLARI